MNKKTYIAVAIISGFVIAGTGLWVTNPVTSQKKGQQLVVTQAKTSDGKLKSGMVDPKTGRKIKYWAAPMNPTYIRNEPGQSPMGMDLVPVYEEEGGEKESTSTIRIDPVTVQNMGVRFQAVVKQPLVKSIRTYGNITYDETRIYSVNTKFDGWIEKLYVNFEGATVRKGQPLFEIYSPDLVTAQEEYLLALKQFNSLSESSFPHIRDGAKSLRKASETKLRYWDLSAEQIKSIGSSGKVKKALTVYSPVKGVVIEKNVYEGHMVQAGVPLYKIADLSRVWVDVDIYEYELPWIQQGMKASMQLSYIPGKRFEGKVIFVYPYLSAKTRTARLRLVFDNPDLQLKPDMYANIFLESRLPGESLVIPQEAIIDSGVRKIVFVALGKGRFEPREVLTGVEVGGGKYQILSGLEEGEQIVTSAQFMLDSESRLREAIQKMIEIRNKPESSEQDDIDMDSMDMTDGTDDLDISNVKMDPDK